MGKFLSPAGWLINKNVLMVRDGKKMRTDTLLWNIHRKAGILRYLQGLFFCTSCNKEKECYERYSRCEDYTESES